MSIDDMRLTLDWAGAEGWNPGLGDAEPFLAADPEGMLMGVVDGEPAVSIAAVRYGATYGFIGLYICRADYRGHGYGAALARAGLARLEGRVIGLDGVVARIDNYARLGFAPAHRSYRFGGIVDDGGPRDRRVIEIDTTAEGAVIAFDRHFFPAEREAFLRAWLMPGPTRHGLAFVEDGTLTGYGVVRQCGEGAKIGPLFALGAEGADVLFRALATAFDGPIFLDIPEPNPDGLELAERYSLSTQFETVRMYRGPEPLLPLANIFGITSFELG